jgi:hypothetical protein
MTRYLILLLSVSVFTLSCGILAASFGLSPHTAFLTLPATSPAIQIHYGETIAGGIDDLGNYDFLGKAGDVVVIQMEATMFTPVLILHNVDGSAAASDDGADYPVAVIGPLVLRQDGAYRVFTGRRESVTQGSFTLRLEQVEPQAIAYGDTVEVEFAESESARYFRFDAGILDEVTITVTGDDTLDTRLRMRESTDSYDFAFDDDSGEGLHPLFRDLRIPYTNQYLITLERTTAGTKGTVTLTLQGRGITSLDDGLQTFTLNSTRSQVQLPFEARAGEQVWITVGVISGNAEALRVMLTQDGRTYVVGSGSSLNELRLHFTVPADGTVNVICDSLVEVEVQASLERTVRSG